MIYNPRDYGTSKQWAAIGYSVKKGERAKCYRRLDDQNAIPLFHRDQCWNTWDVSLEIVSRAEWLGYPDLEDLVI